eukprot:588002-Amphidinium_carterae.2
MTLHAMFEGGRTPYQQALWPGMSWDPAQPELNRAVKRKPFLWCICIAGGPVDPSSRVPLASSPYDVIDATVRRLREPLNYEEMRREGRLAVPLHPTHTGVDGHPIEAEVEGAATASSSGAS